MPSYFKTVNDVQKKVFSGFSEYALSRIISTIDECSPSKILWLPCGNLLSNRPTYLSTHSPTCDGCHVHILFVLH